MRSVLTIAAKDLTQRGRDRSIFIIGIVAPLTLAAIFNLVFGGGVSDVGANITLEMGVVDDDPGPLSDVFTEILTSIEADGLIDLTTYPDEATARARGRRGRRRCGFPARFVAVSRVSPLVPMPPSRSWAMSTPPRPPGSPPRSPNSSPSVFVEATLGAVASLLAGTITPDQVEAAATEAAAAAPTLTLGDIPAATRQLDASTYFVAGLSIFFLFFIAGMAVTSLLDERRNGTLARLARRPDHAGVRSWPASR